MMIANVHCAVGIAAIAAVVLLDQIVDMPWYFTAAFVTPVVAVANFVFVAACLRRINQLRDDVDQMRHEIDAPY